MLYRALGRTGRKVSAIGFGGMRFADMNDIEGSAELVRQAYAAGLTYFDTAPGYGRGKSEEIFGAAFRDMRRTRRERPFTVATKTSVRTAAEVRPQIEQSLERMGLDHVDCYHVWCVITPEDFAKRRANGVLDEFVRLKEEKLVRHIFLSSHMTGPEIAGALGEFPFEGLLLGYSAMNFAYREDGVQAAADRGVGVVCMNPLGGGIIPSHPERFAFLRTGRESVAQAALRFLLDDPRIAVALVGFSNAAELREATAAAEGFEGLPPGRRSHMRESLKAAFNEMCTGCGYCDECPEGVPIPKLMEAYNHRLLSGKDGPMMNRLRWHWGIEADDPYLAACEACGRCEELCTQKLPIIQRLAEVREAAEAAQAAEG